MKIFLKILLRTLLKLKWSSRLSSNYDKIKNMVTKNTRKKKRTFSWMNPKLEVRDTKKYGKGVFTKKDIKKDEIKMLIY